MFYYFECRHCKQQKIEKNKEPRPRSRNIILKMTKTH